MALRPTLHFLGNAEEVLNHYRAALGGELEIMRFAGSPAEEMMPADWQDKVMYGVLRSPLGEIAAMDAPPGRGKPAGGNYAICADLDDEARARQIFTKLAEAGAIDMPFEPTFFAKQFGMATDKFGVSWIVNVPLPQGAAATA